MNDTILTLIGWPTCLIAGILYMMYRLNLGIRLTDLEIGLLKPQSLQVIPHSKIYSYLAKHSVINLLMLLFLLVCFAAQDLYIYCSQVEPYKEAFSSEHMDILLGFIAVILSIRMEMKIRVVRDRL